MSRAAKLLEGNLSYFEILGRDLGAEEQKQFFTIASDNEYGSSAQKGADIAIAQCLALRGFSPTDSSDGIDVYRERPVVFSHDKHHNDRGLLAGYVGMVKFISRLNNWDIFSGRFAYEPTPYTVVGTKGAVLVGQSIEIGNEAEVNYALPDVMEKFDSLVELGHLSPNTEYISAYVVYERIGKNARLLDQVRNNDMQLHANRAL